jgi:hypothetical protein
MAGKDFNMKKAQAKKLIELYETMTSGYHRLSGAFVIVSNLHFQRETGEWICDLETGIQDEDGGNKEWFYAVGYPQEVLLRIEKEAIAKGLIK